MAATCVWGAKVQRRRAAGEKSFSILAGFEGEMAGN